MNNKLTVFTNGCFDILHLGHIELLKNIKELYPDCKLIVGLNGDTSVKVIKGQSRPVFNQDDRKSMLEAIKYVDEVIIFYEKTPSNLIYELRPDIVVKGFDYYKEEIAGCDYVKRAVTLVKMLSGFSTSAIIKKIKQLD